MTKKPINQNDIFNLELLNSISTRYLFDNKPINRLKSKINIKKVDNNDKHKNLDHLKKEINSIEDCNFKDNSSQIVFGNGDINSPIMIIGGVPNIEDDVSGKVFSGADGELLKKMLSAINITIENIYLTYAINFRPFDDRKPSSTEIKRYSDFLKKHINIINPQLIIIMGSIAMESLTGINAKISVERGIWKETIIQNDNYNLIVTFDPSYLLRIPENKKHAWEDLKKIRNKIDQLKLTIK
jgi:uracil-DNA glycosylase family 4|tara:strand:- start:1597 stop:2319 length:723 start_codon:yes stop_codon:yes gene_type:complete